MYWQKERIRKIYENAKNWEDGTKLPSTSMTVISLIFLVMNLSNPYRQVLLIFLCQFSGIKDIFRKSIKLNYQMLSSKKEKSITTDRYKYE